MGCSISKLVDDSKSDIIDFELPDKDVCFSNFSEFEKNLWSRGLLLKTPRDTTPLHTRGVSKAWLSIFLALLPKRIKSKELLWNTTKLVADVIKRLTSSTERPLYDYIPQSCVNTATVFVSYSWDYVVKEFVDDLPDEGFFWIDFCAVSQHSNSHSKEEISSIGDVVKRISNTRLIVDATYMVGNYCSYITKLGHSLTRAWVLYEIGSTPKASLNIQFQCTIVEPARKKLRSFDGGTNSKEWEPQLWRSIRLGRKPKNAGDSSRSMRVFELTASEHISVVPPFEDCSCRYKADKDMILGLLKERFVTFEVAHQFILEALKRTAKDKLS